MSAESIRNRHARSSKPLENGLTNPNPYDMFLRETNYIVSALLLQKHNIKPFAKGLIKSNPKAFDAGIYILVNECIIINN